MFSLTPRGFSRKWICTVAAAVAAAAIAAASLAGSAFAIPNDVVVKMDPFSATDRHLQFGQQGSCAAGQAPGGDANLDWQQNLNAGTIQPKLTGSVCVQSNTGTYRVALELYHLDSTPGPGVQHVKISESFSLDATGNGSASNSFDVNLQGPKLLFAAVDHAHIQLQQKVNNVWQNVPGANTVRTVDYP
jgi:hypothetical protein